MSLDRVGRITVSKLAAILRVANALDRLRSRRSLHLEMSIERNRFIIETPPDQDISAVQQRVRDRSYLFSSVFGKEIQLRSKRT